MGLAAALAPVLLVCGSLLARPPFMMAALGVVLTFPLIAGLGATNATHIAGALNSSVALFVGTAAALCSMRLFQTLDADRSRARLLGSIRHEIARRVSGRGPITSDWLSDATQRGVAGDIAVHVAVIAHRAAAEIGFDRARRQGVHGYTAGT